MVFLYLINQVSAWAELVSDPSKYTNYESAVNPQYYIEHIQPYKLADYGYLVTHRKLGLSKGNEKIVYEGWLKLEFRDFKNHIDDYLCMKKKLCTKSNNMQDILIKLKDENEIIKEEFFKALIDDDFIKTCQKMVDLVERYFDEGYHHYEHLKAMVSETDDLIVFLNYANKTKVNHCINKVISILNCIDSYECDSKPEEIGHMS